MILPAGRQEILCENVAVTFVAVEGRKNKQMKAIILIFLINGFCIGFAGAQNLEADKTDSIVSLALSLSEEALYDARLEEAKEIIQLSYFKNFKNLNGKHELLLTIQEIRIEGFITILYLKKPNPIANFEKLNTLMPLTKEIIDEQALGNYFLALSSSYRSIGNVDSAGAYQEKALLLFQKGNNLKRVAEVRASDISRNHNQLLRQGKKEEILKLMPKYKEEIAFSEEYSKYAMAYNTRHLAQIHRRQTLDYEAALQLFQESLHLREEIGFKPFIPASYSSIGDVYLKMKKYQDAIEMYAKSSELAVEIGFIRYQIYPNLNIGDIYLAQGQKEKAMEHYTKALKLASANNYIAGLDSAIEHIKKVTLTTNGRH